jgi:hypothetical protein
MKGWYKRVQHDPENNGKAITNVQQSSLKKIDKRAFNAYESTTTGSAKDQKVSNPLLGNFKLLLFVGIMLISGYKFFTGDSTFAPVKVVDSTVSQVGTNEVSLSGDYLSNYDISVNDASNGFSFEDAVLDVMHSIKYYSGNTLYLKGSKHRRINYFHSDKYGQLTDYNLKYFDIDFKPISNMFILSFKGIIHLIPEGNPNPDYSHFESSSNNTRAPVVDAALAKESSGARVLF